MKKKAKKSGSNSPIVNGIYLAAGLYVASKIYTAITKLNVRNKVVLITGGSRGLGLIMARQLADMQAKVVICARNKETLSKAAADLAARTPHSMALPCDITDKAQVQRMISEVEEKIGRVEILQRNGHESETKASTSILTKMTEKAEEKYNQLTHKNT
jgi:NAD(P)-dependent dehydrogenase (short-subunit alcohol dehydrogenase family)